MKLFALGIVVLVTSAVCLAVPGRAAPDKGPPTAFECRWAEGPVTIDGRADEAAWKNAQLIDHFYVPWTKDARRARTATKARLLWDREYLYFYAEMEDTDLYADIKENDGMLWENDVFELFFKPAEDKPGYYELQVNAAGAVLDMFLPRRGAGGYRRFIKDGDFHVEAKVRLEGTLNHWQDKDTGWSVEGRIPWRDFLRSGGGPKPDDTWKFALCRYDYSVDFEGPEQSTCAPLKGPNPDFHHHEDYANLRFVGPGKRGAAKPFRIDRTFGMPATGLVAPGHPERPALLQRMAHRGEGHMPPLATSFVDQEVVRLLHTWIRSLEGRRGG
jgi:hypothetical protein